MNNVEKVSKKSIVHLSVSQSLYRAGKVLICHKINPILTVQRGVESKENVLISRQFLVQILQCWQKCFNKFKMFLIAATINSV